MPGRTNLTILAALTLAAGLISPLALAIDGTADPAWGTNGRTALTPLVATDRSVALDLALTGSGPVVVGRLTDANGVWSWYAVRLGASGNPDGSFGSFGRRAFRFPDTRDEGAPARVFAQADGRLLLIGQVDAILADGGIDRTPAVAMLTASGQLDLSFHGDGRRILLDPRWNNRLFLRDVIPRAGGRYLLLTSARNLPGTQDIGLLQVTVLGTVDAQFGDDGLRLVEVGPPALDCDRVNTIAELPGGGFWIAGTCLDGEPFVARLNADGTPNLALDDPPFNDGFALISPPPGVPIVNGDTGVVALLASTNDDFWIAWYANPSPNTEVSVVANYRRMPTPLGPTIWSSGTPAVFTEDEGVRLAGLVRDPAGRMLAYGRIDPLGADPDDFFVARLVSNFGAVQRDASFDGNGVARFAFPAVNGSTGDMARVAVFDGGRPLLAGFSAATAETRISTLRLRDDYLFRDGYD